MDMLHAMRAFVRVVDTGSFTAAARQTDTSTAQVSRLVSELENHLHARLLQRTTRRLALTEVGARFLERSREILAQLDDARQEACGAHLTPRGRLRLHSTTGLGIQLLSSLAGHYCERYPEVSLDLSPSQRQPDLLEAGLDVIITLSRDLPDSELIAQRLGPVFHVVCAAPSYLQRHGVPRRPTDLHDHRCLRLLDPVFADDWHFVGDGVEEVIRPGETFKVNVAEAMASAAEAGMGICLLPDYVAAPALQRGTLLRLLPQYRLQEKQIHALYPSRRFLDAKIRTWLDFLAQALPRAFDDYHRVLRDETHWA